MVIEARHSQSVDALREVLPQRLQRSLRMFAHHLEGRHFPAQTQYLTGLSAARFIFQLSHHSFVHTEVRLAMRVGGVEGGEIEVVRHHEHGLVEIRRVDLIQEGICFHEEQMRQLPIILLDDVVVKSRES